jgi:hypothetical protein
MSRSQEIDAAMQTVSNDRQMASVCKQLGLFEAARWHLQNAKNAERWAAKR